MQHTPFDSDRKANMPNNATGTAVEPSNNWWHYDSNELDWVEFNVDERRAFATNPPAEDTFNLAVANGQRAERKNSQQHSLSTNDGQTTTSGDKTCRLILGLVGGVLLMGSAVIPLGLRPRSSWYNGAESPPDSEEGDSPIWTQEAPQVSVDDYEPPVETQQDSPSEEDFRPPVVTQQDSPPDSGQDSKPPTMTHQDSPPDSVGDSKPHAMTQQDSPTDSIEDIKQPIVTHQDSPPDIIGDFKPAIETQQESTPDSVSDPKPPTMTQRDVDWLDSHNTRRKTWHTKHGKRFVPLKWSNALKEESRVWAEKLAESGEGIWHDPDNSFGENIAGNSGTGSWAIVRTTDNILSRFVEEEEDVPYPNNGHLTQVLWRATKYVGCAEAFKPCGSDGSGMCHTQVCRYARAGNCNMGSFMVEDVDDWWLEPMLMDDSPCGVECPPEDGCY